jgi:predicted small secreted protein
MKAKVLIVVLFLTGILFEVNAQESKNETKALEYIKSHAEEFQINPKHGFKLHFVRKGKAGETLRFQQMLNDVPVFESEFVVNFNNKNEVAFTSNSYKKEIQLIDTSPTVTKEKAIAITDDKLNYNGAVTLQEAKLYVYDFNGVTKLVYRTITHAEDLVGSWEVLIDAKTSDVISVKDVSIRCGKECKEDHTHDFVNKVEKKKKKVFSTVEENNTFAFTTGTAMVFLSDPLSAAAVPYGGQYVDGNDATNASLDAARATVNLPEIEVLSGTYKLKSSYVEIKDIEAPNKGLFTQSTPNFLFNRNQDGFEAANVFYHLDNNMRYINETLGVNCRPYLHSGVLWFDPSGFNGADNSRYSGAGNDLSFGEGCVDDGEDGDVIWHELGHGLHDWMTGGGGLSQVNGLSEGCGDYWAQSNSRSLNQWTPADAAYHWMFNWDGHNECWGGRTTNYGATYPGGLVGGGPHTDGQIWSTTLMKIWDVLGRAKTDTAFLEGLALTNSSTNQNQAAIAVRQAAINMNYSCADVKVMTEKFSAVGYTMPAIPLTINCPGTQTVNADGSGNYVLPSFASLTNAINSNCDATVTQSPAVGTTVGVGSHSITMTANGSVNCNFTLVVEAALGNEGFIKASEILLYPNPASSSITIKGEFDNLEKIQVYNMLGQVVMNGVISGNETTLNVSKLSNGVYTINFLDSNVSVKFVKE